jgi:hypothetical protein
MVKIQKIKYHSFFYFCSMDSKSRKAIVLVKGFFITLGANPLKASPDLNNTLI